MNWGHKITVVFIIFVLGISYLVYRTSLETQDLVTTNYYEKELKYQDRIDAIELASNLSAPVTAVSENGIVFINFPKEFNDKVVTSNIQLYCSFNAKNDEDFKLEITNGTAAFKIKSSQEGIYTLKIEWSSEGKNYYSEKSIYIK